MLPADYQTESGFDAAEDHIGPFYFRRRNDMMDCAFVAEDKHCNGNGTVHGGVLMTFADYALCMAATNGYDGESCVTVSFNSQFLASAENHQIISCLPKVNRVTGSMVFVTGELISQGDVCLTFSAVVKRLRS